MTRHLPIFSIIAFIHRLSHFFALLLLLLSPALAADDTSSDPSSAPASPIARVERFRCLPAGLCETCTPAQASNPSCLAFGRHRPLTCISLTPIEDKADEALEKRASSLSEEEASQLLLCNGTAWESWPGAGSSSNSQDRWTYPSSRRRRHGPQQQAKRDFFWSGHETPAKKAAKIIDQVDWDSVRENEAREQGIRDQGVRFKSYAPCARVISKERSDFGEFVLCNVVLVVLGLMVLFTRHRKLAMRQYVRLAARIGIPGTMV